MFGLAFSASLNFISFMVWFLFVVSFFSKTYGLVLQVGNSSETLGPSRGTFQKGTEHCESYFEHVGGAFFMVSQ